MRSILIAAALALLALFAGEARGQGDLELEALLAEAQAGNPGLAAYRDRYEAASERVPQAGAFDDPMLSAGFMAVEVDNFRFDQIPMTTKFVGLSQKLPFFGKRALRREAAGREAVARQAEYNDRALSVRAEVKKAYYGLYGLKKSLEITGKNIELMDVFNKIAQTRYSVGKGILKDVVKAQVEQSVLLEKKLEFEREEKTMRAMLGGLLGRDAPVAGEVKDIAATPVETDRDALLARALEARPALAAARERVGRSEAMVKLAGKEYYPDFMVSAEYHQTETLEDGTRQSDRIAAMVTVNLPVWLGSKLRPGVREAAAEKAMAENMRRDAEAEITAAVDALLSEITLDDRMLKLYSQVVIPQATEDLDSALAGYEVGRVDFLTLLDSRRALFEYEMSYYTLLAAREKAVAGLEAAVGGGVRQVNALTQ